MARLQAHLLSLISPHFLVIFSAAFGYTALAELSRDIASTPNSVTPVWPPDGLAVGMTLLYGKQVLIGVFIGSFLANIQAFWNDQSSIDSLLSIFAVLGIAAGTTVGTQLGVFLLRKFNQNRHPLNRVSDVMKFLVYTRSVE